MAQRKPNPSPRVLTGFPAPIAHRFDPLDHDALQQEPLRADSEELARAIAYAPPWSAGAFSDQSPPEYPAAVVLVLLALLLAAVAHATGSIAALPIRTPWVFIAAVSFGTWAVFYLLPFASPAAMPLQMKLLVASLVALVLSAAFYPNDSKLLRLFLVIASLSATAVFAHALTEHVRTHLRALALNPLETKTELTAHPAPYLILFVPLIATFSMRSVLPLLALPWLPALYLAYRALERHPEPFRSPFQLLFLATESWLRYGSRGEDAPGVLESPAGKRVSRLLATALLILLLGALFAPFPAITNVVLEAVHEPVVLVRCVLQWIGAGLIPLSIIGSASLAFLASALADVPAHLTIKGGEPALSDPDRWALVVERVRKSTRQRVLKQLFVGFHATEHYPVFVPRETIREHVSIMGATSAGKTSRVLLPLVSQLLRIEEVDRAAKSPLVVIDLKGERYFFNAVRKEAERAGRPFWYFSNHPYRGTHAFNPVLDLRELRILPQQVALTLHAALNLEHGTGYGPGYFSALTRNYLATLLELAPHSDCMADLYAARDKLRKIYPRERERREIEREAAELISYLKALSLRPELNVTSRSPDQDCFAARISMTRAIETGAVVYFNLFSKGEEAIARFIGSLALECLYAATYRFNEDPPSGEPAPERKQVYAVVDEFQRIAGRNFGVFLEQARSAGLSLILAKQSETLIDPELHDAVQTNTTYRHYFTFRSPEAIQAGGALFGETAYYTSIDEGLETLKQFLGPRFTANDLRALSALPGHAASVQETSRDFSQFHGQAVALYSPFHISREDHDKIAAEPLPVDEPGTLTVGEAAKTERTQERQSEYVPAPPPFEETDLARSFEQIHVTHEGYFSQEVS